MKTTEQIKINAPATRDAIRARYGSVSDLARQMKVTLRTLNYALTQERGVSNRKELTGKAKRVIARLAQEGLLVEVVS